MAARRLFSLALDDFTTGERAARAGGDRYVRGGHGYSECGEQMAVLIVTGLRGSADSIREVSGRKAVALYSGLVLHDIGTGDGIARESAQWNEMRTPTLPGLRLRLD